MTRSRARCITVGWALVVALVAPLAVVHEAEAEARSTTRVKLELGGQLAKDRRTGCEGETLSTQEHLGLLGHLEADYRSERILVAGAGVGLLRGELESSSGLIPVASRTPYVIGHGAARIGAQLDWFQASFGVSSWMGPAGSALLLPQIDLRASGVQGGYARIAIGAARGGFRAHILDFSGGHRSDKVELGVGFGIGGPLIVDQDETSDGDQALRIAADGDVEALFWLDLGIWLSPEWGLSVEAELGEHPGARAGLLWRPGGPVEPQDLPASRRRR